jgi:hypothetical protein
MPSALSFPALKGEVCRAIGSMGPNGNEFTSLKKGAISFRNEQTLLAKAELINMARKAVKSKYRVESQQDERIFACRAYREHLSRIPAIIVPL